MTITQQPSPDWDMLTLKWAGAYLDGTPAEGWVELVYNSPGPMLDDDTVTPLSIFSTGIKIPITTTNVVIDGETRTVGYIQVRVPASNDPDIIGGGGSYAFTEKLNKGGGRSNVNFVADKDAPGGVIWINRLPGEGSTPAEPVSAVYYSDFDTLTGRVQALEDTPHVSTWDDLTGKPATFPPSTHNHDDRYYTETEADARFQPAGTYATPSDVSTASTADRSRSNHTGTQPYTTITGLGTAATASAADYATSAQGAKADTAVQPAALASKADLTGPGGTVPASQLPSYVDDVLEFANQAAFPATGESGKLYVALDTSKLYRWSGSVYAVISDTIALGETSTTAYRGDLGKTAYDHSQITAGNPHGVTKAHVGLANADNTSDAAKPVSTAQQTALDGKQPLDSDLTAIAALTTTAYGRNLLTPADAAAARALLGITPAPIVFSADTAKVTVTGSDRAESARTITGARMRCTGAPVGSALTAVVQHSTDGSTWTDVTTLTIAAGSTTEAVSGALSQTQTAGNLVRLNVTSVGSTTAATGVVVTVALT